MVAIEHYDTRCEITAMFQPNMINGIIIINVIN